MHPLRSFVALVCPGGFVGGGRGGSGAEVCVMRWRTLIAYLLVVAAVATVAWSMNFVVHENCKADNNTRSAVLDLARRGTPEVREAAEAALPQRDCTGLAP